MKQKERGKAEILRVNEQRSAAWISAMLQRQPKLPTMESILVNEEKSMPKAQTPEQMLAALRMITMVCGGKIVEA